MWEMSESLEEILSAVAGAEKQPAGGKVMDLSEAVRRCVEPGMSIQTGNGMAFPAAAYYEIARQFWGKKPGFTLIGNTGGRTTSPCLFTAGFAGGLSPLSTATATLSPARTPSSPGLSRKGG
jgi:hypothetical protein